MTTPQNTQALPVYAEQFIDHGRYLRAWSPKTEVIYRRALKAFGDTPITKPVRCACLTRFSDDSSEIGDRER